MRDELASLFRARVRSASPYVVGSSPGITVKLNQNENPRVVLADQSSRLRRILGNVELNRYPREQPDLLRASISAYAGVSQEQLLVTHGSNEFVHSLCLAFIEPGRRALIPTPSFSLFRNSVLLFGGDLIEVEADDAFDFPIDEICRVAAEESPELVIIAAPNNPTGRDISIDDVERIAAASRGMVVVDEAYWEFTSRSSAVSLLDRYDNLIVMRTLSKAFGLAGIRVGYAVARPDVIHELLKVRLPFMVSDLDSALAAEVLAVPGIVRETASRLKKAQQQIADAISRVPGVEIVPSETNFVLFRTPLPSAAVMAGMVERGILIRDMSGYRQLSGFLRVNAGTDDENTAFVNALNEVLSTFRDRIQLPDRTKQTGRTKQ